MDKKMKTLFFVALGQICFDFIKLACLDKLLQNNYSITETDKIMALGSFFQFFDVAVMAILVKDWHGNLGNIFYV